eukprot:gene15706-17291_t
MERLQRLARSLRTARAAELPSDVKGKLTEESMLLVEEMMKQSLKLADEANFKSIAICPFATKVKNGVLVTAKLVLKVMAEFAEKALSTDKGLAQQAVAELLTSSDFNVNHSIGRAQRTLLHIAANVGAYECVLLLLKKGADVSSQDRSGVTPLQLAARNGHTKCIHKLLESMSKDDITKCSHDGMTALHWLASNGRTEILLSFLPFIENIDVEDGNQQTPLHLACLTGHRVTVLKLIENGADIERLDSRGYTPLLYACSHEHVDIVCDLLDRGAKYSKNHGYMSPLKISLENGHKEVCYVLVERHNELENLLIMAQSDSIDEAKALEVLKYICAMNLEYHRQILIRLAELTGTAGLELLCASSDFESTEKHFSRTLKFLYSLYTNTAEEMVPRPRSETVPIGTRSRVDSTSTRLLRTLTANGAERGRNFRPPVEQMDEALNTLWDSLEHWFDLIKDELRRMPDSSSALNKEDLESGGTQGENGEIKTWLIASELVRSKPKVKSNDRRSIASIESIRMSQPALEYNLARMNEDLNGSGSLSRSLGRMIMNRSIDASNHDHSDHADYDDGYERDESGAVGFGGGVERGEIGDGVLIGGVTAPTNLVPDDRDRLDLQVRDQGSVLSDAVHGDVLVDSTSEQFRRPQPEQSPRRSSLPVDVPSSSEDATIYRDRGYTRSLSYTHAVSQEPVASDMLFGTDGQMIYGDANLCDDGEEGDALSPIAETSSSSVSSFPQLTGDGAESRNASRASMTTEPESGIDNLVFDGEHNDAGIACSEVLQEKMTSDANAATNAAISVSDAAVNANAASGRHTEMVEKVSDRLCAVIHGFHLASYKRPFWETPRKFKARVAKFNQFIMRNEVVIQLFVARKPKIIFDHFHFLLDSPLLLQRYLPVIHEQSFKDRQEWFYENLYHGHDTTVPVADERMQIMIARDSLLLSSCSEVSKKNSDILKKNVAVQFEGEAGMGEGVVREWLDLLFKEILNPDCALFTLSADGSTFQPNSNSAVNPDHLNYFEFAGRMMGMAMFHKRLVNASFTRSFYKHILGIPVDYQDVASIDPEYAKNLQWILDNDISQLGLDLTFAIETDVFGKMQEVDLKFRGRDVPVTEENKVEYVQLAADLKMTQSIKRQIYSFLEGFHEFIPHSLVTLFNEYELELILSGIPEFDYDDWKSNTTYQGGYTADSQQVIWFWEVLKQFSQEDRAQLLQFVTGSSRIPYGGFSTLYGASSQQNFTISSVAYSKDILPSTSTCFNLLKLPEYGSKEELRNKLVTAIKHGTRGFEMA